MEIKVQLILLNDFLAITQELRTRYKISATLADTSKLSLFQIQCKMFFISLNNIISGHDMPELPEVETCAQALAPKLIGQTVKDVIIHQPSLRWPVPADLKQNLINQNIISFTRRAKYLLLTVANGTAIIHLGMSGRLRLLSCSAPRQKHDHVELILINNHCLRFHDPRRFGCWLWHTHPESHALIAQLGPEPFADEFSVAYMQHTLAKRRTLIKHQLMDAHFVVGVGNIYANEALFYAGIAPIRTSHSLSAEECARLHAEIRNVLGRAIKAGGTTLKDFINPEGNPGYFSQELAVYGRAQQPCIVCQTPLQSLRLQQRITVFCPKCQR